MATIFERIRKITVAQLVNINEEEVTPSSNFTDDLGADSLDMVELMMALEEEFTTPGRKVGIPDEDAEKILTVQDAMDYIHDKGVTDNELSKAEAKAVSKPAPRPVVPVHPEANKAVQARQGQGVRPSPQARSSHNRQVSHHPGSQHAPQHHNQQQRHQPQQQKPPGKQQSS